MVGPGRQRPIHSILEPLPFVDNHSSMKDAKDSKFYVRTKHIDMHHYSIPERVSCGGIKGV
jgi:hypothetical protein